jgi:hypothetical protein
LLEKGKSKYTDVPKQDSEKFLFWVRISLRRDIAQTPQIAQYLVALLVGLEKGKTYCIILIFSWDLIELIETVSSISVKCMFVTLTNSNYDTHLMSLFIKGLC